MGVGDWPWPRSTCGAHATVLSCYASCHAGVCGELVSCRRLGCFGWLTGMPPCIVCCDLFHLHCPLHSSRHCMPFLTHSVLFVHGRRCFPRRSQASCALPGVALLPFTGMDGANWLPAGAVGGCGYRPGADRTTRCASTRGGGQHHPGSIDAAVKAGGTQEGTRGLGGGGWNPGSRILGGGTVMVWLGRGENYATPLRSLFLSLSTCLLPKGGCVTLAGTRHLRVCSVVSRRGAERTARYPPRCAGPTSRRHGRR